MTKTLIFLQFPTGFPACRQNLSRVRTGTVWFCFVLLMLWPLSGAQAQPVRPDKPTPTPSPAVNLKVGELLLLKAEKVRRVGTRMIADGNVNVELSGLRLDCQHLEYDQKTGQIKADKECLFYWGESYAAADSVDFDTRTNQATMNRVAGRGSDLIANSRLVEVPLFFWADKVYWQPKKVELFGALVTTCDEVPGDFHYTLESERVDIYPRDRLEARNSTLTLGETRLYTVPNVTLSLNPKRRREQNFLPSPGYNSLSGAFIRNAIGYAFDDDNFGKIHLDYYTRSGIAGGIEHNFTIGDEGGGNIYFYRQRGAQSQQGRLDLRANLGYKIDDYTVLGFNYAQNQFELPGFVSPLTIGSGFAINRLAPGSALSFGTNFSRSGDNSNSNYRVFYEVDLDEEWSGTLTADYAQAATAAARSHRFHYLGSLTHRGSVFDSELTVENTGGQQTYFLNRNPEFRINSHPLYAGPVPFLASASFGNIEESPSFYRSTRYDLRLEIPDQEVELPLGRLEFGGGMRQLLYGNGEAQYVLLGRGGYVQNFGEVAVARFDYNWQLPRGYTPFQHDLQFPYSIVTGGLEFHDSDHWALSATAGYDLRFNAPHDIITRLDVKPTPGWVLSASSNYDPNTALWRSVDSLVSMELTEGVSVTHWSVYDLINERLRYQDVSLNFESHDWVASIAYRGVQQEVFFQFSLKAFPSPPIQVGPQIALPVLPQNLPNAFVR